MSILMGVGWVRSLREGRKHREDEGRSVDEAVFGFFIYE